MSSRRFALGAITFLLFACSTEPKSACNADGCGSYHHQAYDDQGSEVATGTIEVTTPTPRHLDTSTGLVFTIRQNGTLDLTHDETVAYVPPPWCHNDASDDASDAAPAEAGASADAASEEAGAEVDATADTGADTDAGSTIDVDAGDADADAGTRDARARDADVDAGHPHPECERHPPHTERHARAHVALALPSDSGDYDLADVGAELWYCASPDADLLPVAARDGSIVPGCFDGGRDFVAALREPLDGKLTVFDPPVSLDGMPKEDSGFAFHYRIATSAQAAVHVAVDVSAWHKHTLVSCGEFY